MNEMTAYYRDTVQEFRSLEPEMERIEKEEGMWNKISWDLEPNMLNGNPGVFHIYRKK